MWLLTNDVASSDGRKPIAHKALIYKCDWKWNELFHIIVACLWNINNLCDVILRLQRDQYEIEQCDTNNTWVVFLQKLCKAGGALTPGVLTTQAHCNVMSYFWHYKTLTDLPSSRGFDGLPRWTCTQRTPAGFCRTTGTIRIDPIAGGKREIYTAFSYSLRSS